MEKEKGKVFISYSRYSQAHRDLVLAFADLLRKYKIDAVLDQYESCTSEGWPKWMDIQVKKAEFVLIICSESYWNRINGVEENGGGSGVYFETTISYNHIYFDRQKTNRFIPILFDRGDIKYVPSPIKGFSYYCIDNTKGAEELYRRLTDQPSIIKPELGQERQLPPTNPEIGEFADRLSQLVKTMHKPIIKGTNIPAGELLSPDFQQPIKKDPIFSTLQERLQDSYDFSGGLIATGTYSRVYMVHNKTSNRDHALKLMNFNLILHSIKAESVKDIKNIFEKKREEFEKEAQFFYEFRKNPNILGYVNQARIPYVFHDVLFEIPYLISKYIKGVSLNEYIHAKGPLEWKHILNISEKILSTIELIHQQGFFYWNIRPEKIIISDDDYNPVLLDADMPEHISSLTDLSGTKVIINKDLFNVISYLSPQAKERKAEIDSIICLFGILLYEMTTQDTDIRDEFGFL
ncbi:MAG: hypothetical protein QG657_2469, partial [Acidobacteriota bacterium]|nr:hypothetical protein [Acidobacteriota bacterium]